MSVLISGMTTQARRDTGLLHDQDELNSFRRDRDGLSAWSKSKPPMISVPGRRRRQELTRLDIRSSSTLGKRLCSKW